MKMRTDYFQPWWLLLLFLAVFSMAVHADSVSTPPIKIRQWNPTATVTSATTTFEFAEGVSGQTVQKKSAAVTIIHDGTTGDPDLYISLTSTAAVPTDGGNSFTVKAGEHFSFDTETFRVSYRSASATVTFRIVVSYSN